jgi:hypothetical protein
MNIKFANKLAHDCWHAMCQDENHHQALLDWAARFLAGSWAGDPSIEHIPQAPDRDPDDPRPDWRNQTGTVSELVISVRIGDTYLLPAHTHTWSDGENDHEFTVPARWATKEFNWAVVTCPVNRFGDIDEPIGRTRVINGGFINHGTHEDPSWSSHT